MKVIRQLMTTTHVDRHGERMTREALESIAAFASQAVLPVGIEHDPRSRPIGRIRAAELERLSDGEFGLFGDVELFDTANPPDYLMGRELPIYRGTGSAFTLGYDRSFRGEADQADLAALGAALACEPGEAVKKSVEPIGVIVLGVASVAVGTIGTAILKRLAEDAYEAVKGRLKSLFSRGDPSQKEKLLQISLAAEIQGYQFEIQVLATNPNAVNIDYLLSAALAQVDTFVQGVHVEASQIRRLVFELQEGSVKFKFAVRSDAVPIETPDPPPERRGGA